MRVSGEERLPDYRFEQSTVIACPPSLVLETIEQHFKRQGNALDLRIPVADTDNAGTQAPECAVTVDCEAHPNRSFVARFDDRMVLRWCNKDEKLPHFAGRFTVRPFGTRTELVLKGSYRLPAGLPRRCAACRIQLVLETLKGVLETEFAAFKRSHL